MKRQLRMIGLILAAVVILASGCTNYVITQGLEQPLLPSQSVFIGEIKDGLPEGTDPDKKPTLEDINKFRAHLANEISKKKFFGTGELYDSTVSRYEVAGAILSYKKGSGFLRFLFGQLAGSAEVTVALGLRDKDSKQLLFSGNFRGSVSSWAEAGDKMFENVSRDFAKAVDKQNKKATKAAQSADASR